MLALIQARMSSRRLPGKVLMKVGGQPLLAFLVDRLQRCTRLSGIAIVTSDDSSDDAVASFAAGLPVQLFRGDLADVVSRFIAASRVFEANAFVRVNGDSPLLDPALVDRGVALFEEGGVDLATNVFPRSFPKGQSVEVVAVDALRRVAEESDDADDHEHVTRYIYNNPGRFRIRNFAGDRDLSRMQMSVDTREDFTAFGHLVDGMARPHWDYGVNELSQMAAFSAAQRQG